MKEEAEIIVEAEGIMGNGLAQMAMDFGPVDKNKESYQPLPSV
jgi:hypothetical protein